MSRREGVGMNGYPNETLLQGAWAGLNFDRRRLATTDLKPIRIFHPGRHNLDQGPDFLHADIQIGKERHHGHVEIHLVSDDWHRHGHNHDPLYNAVMLHVFLQGGKKAAVRADGTAIAELCLGDRIGSPRPFSGRHGLPCAGVGRHFLPESPGAFMESLGVARLREKATFYLDRAYQLKFDWTQLLWEEIAASIGGPVNGEHFRTLAQAAHWGLLRKYVYSVVCLESLLFGIAGMLDGRAIDAYHASLQQHWSYLQQKHGLRQKPIPFKLHRMHPAGFPLPRIAQLAMVAHTFRPLCALLQLETQRSFRDEGLPVSDYWSCRYHFGNTLSTKGGILGKDARDRMLLNALVPIYMAAARGAAGKEISSSEFEQQALALIQEMPPEENKITRMFGPLGLIPRNAVQSQGLIALYKQQCSHHHCRQCLIGSKAIGAPGL